MHELHIVNLIISDSNHIVSVMINLFKFKFSYFRESLNPYFLLFPNFIFRPLLSCNCIIIYLILFLYGNIHPNPGPVQFHKLINTSPLDIFEPFCSSPLQRKLRMALLNVRSVCNKSAVICNHILENSLDILCLTEAWINDGDI